MWIGFLISSVFAAQVLVKAPEADIYAYQVFLENSDNLRPSEMETACSSHDDLQQYFHSANDAFLNGSLEKAKKDFLNAAELKWNCDWKSNDRETISEALFRLSQIAVSDAEKKSWMQAAIDFDDKQPNSKLFPPPLLQAYREMRRQQTSASLSTTKYYDTYTKILRNGRPYAIGKRPVKFPEGTARFTFLSDSHQPKSMVITANELQKMTVASAPFIDGGCKSHVFQKPAVWKAEPRLFFSPECIVERMENQILAASAANVPGLAANPIERQMEMDHAPKKPNWIQRNYLWVGAALVGAVLISAEMNKRKDTQTVITPTNSANTR